MRRLNLEMMDGQDYPKPIVERTVEELPHKIVDALIRLTAHYTDRFGSDMVWDLLSINRELGEKPDRIVRFFGFRDSGVDHKAFIECRYDDIENGFGGIELHPYRAIYKLVGNLNEYGEYEWLFCSLGTFAGREALEEVE